MKNPSARFYLKLTLTLVTLALGFYFVLSAKRFFSSDESLKFVSVFTGVKPVPQWQWCPENPKISYKSNEISRLTDKDLPSICKIAIHSTTPEEVESLKQGQVLLEIVGSDSKRVLLKTDSRLEVFEAGGLPFKNAELTQFFLEKAP